MSDLTNPADANGDATVSDGSSDAAKSTAAAAVNSVPDAAKAGVARAAVQALPDAAKADVVAAAIEALPDAATAGVVATALQTLPDTARAGMVTTAMQDLPDAAKAVATTAAVRALPNDAQADLIERFAPDQAVTNDIWRWIVRTFAVVLGGAMVALVAAVFVSFWREVDIALVQMLLTIFTTTAGILAGFVSGRASTAGTRRV
jgi:hypothetical protein